MKYSNNRLDKLANQELIFPKGGKHYRNLLEKSIKDKGWDYSKLHSDEMENDLIHDELYFDLVEIINELSQLLIDERRERKESMIELKQEIRMFFERENL